MKANKTIAIALSSILVAGCGVTIEAKRMQSPDPDKPVPGLMAGEGVVYALPKTDFEVVQPVKVKLSTSEPLQDTFDTCVRACDANPKADEIKDGRCDFTT